MKIQTLHVCLGVMADPAACLVATNYQAAGTGSKLVISYDTWS